LLLFFGWALYCIGPGHLTFELWNVLAQLSFTYLVAFLMMRKSPRVQIGEFSAKLRSGAIRGANRDSPNS